MRLLVTFVKLFASEQEFVELSNIFGAGIPIQEKTQRIEGLHARTCAAKAGIPESSGLDFEVGLI